MRGSVEIRRGAGLSRLIAGRLVAWANANWKWLTFLIWLGVAAFYLEVRSENIRWFALGDTDDNMRYLQVRDWLAGQGWFDLRQYRLDPPGGANIHWSRLVDLPLAGLMLMFRLFLDAGQADRWACAIAPLLPLLPLMLGLAFITRRLSRPQSGAWIIAAFAPLGAPMGLAMFMPLRIDHHGWQLALTVTMLAGIVDRRWVRGGLVAGLSSALSLAIGMEMMVYLAGAGALIALRWVFKEGAARRMAPYALALGGGTALCFLIFASNANRAPVCDALSPVWVATMGGAAGGMLLLTLLPLSGWRQRLIAGIIVGGIVGGFAFASWPHCFTSAYQIDPQLERLWLSHIREAKPITAQSLSAAIPMIALPLGGALAALIGCLAAQADRERLWAWGTVALMNLFALGLMFWQIRAGPAAQLLAIPAVAWLGWKALELVARGTALQRIGAAVGAGGLWLLFQGGLIYPQLQRIGLVPQAAPVTAQARANAARLARINRANARCRTQPALAPLNRLPPATIMTLVDLGPRLIAVTHHRAIAGPYHRNGKAILDLHHAYDGNADAFLDTARRHGVTYFLHCPDFPEGTVYRARSPNGFYARLERGEIPAWLEPVMLRSGASLPYTLYRIDYAAAQRRAAKKAVSSSAASRSPNPA